MVEQSKISELLALTLERHASDLHLVSGYAPTLRVDGELVPVDSGVLTHEALMQYLESVMTADQLSTFVANKELDFSVSQYASARFRVNVYTQRGTVAAAFRAIPQQIPTIDGLGLPPVLHQFATLRQGFILVTGPTGHGKSTTLAAILDEINTNRGEHIVTIEDPIEFVFSQKRSLVSQREMGLDSHSWPVALRSVLREDTNVVLIGEMRDHETIASALTIAETGHLVFATLHTNSAAQTIDRIVDVFPEEQQDQVKLQLSNVLAAVFSQRLVPTIGGGRTPAYELMTASSAIKNTVREGKTHQIDSIIQTSSDVGMSLIENSLAELVKAGKVEPDVAMSYTLRPDQLSRLITK